MSNETIKFRVIQIPLEEVRHKCSFPNWVPITERMLQTYLVFNPKIIAEKAVLIGIEINFVDMLFKDENSYYIIETKRNPSQIQGATEQLELYLDRLANIANIKGDKLPFTPIVVTFSEENTSNYNLIHNSYVTETSKLYKTLNDTRDEIERNNKQLNKIVEAKKVFKSLDDVCKEVAEYDKLLKAKKKMFTQYLELTFDKKTPLQLLQYFSSKSPSQKTKIEKYKIAKSLGEDRKRKNFTAHLDTEFKKEIARTH